MTIFFKSTRPDGRDFFSGSVDYAAALASGEPLPELPGDGEFPGPGWYHLADVPTACVGTSWPCRLFEVEPVGDICVDSEHPHKIGCTSVRVLREIESHRVFGPQGEQVAALIERCRTLSAAELDRLYAAWDAVLVTARAAADLAGLTRCQRGRVACVARLLCRDLIGQYPGWDQATYDLLTGPWRDVIGPIHHDDKQEEPEPLPAAGKPTVTTVTTTQPERGTTQ